MELVHNFVQSYLSYEMCEGTTVLIVLFLFVVAWLDAKNNYPD